MGIEFGLNVLNLNEVSYWYSRDTAKMYAEKCINYWLIIISMGSSVCCQLNVRGTLSILDIFKEQLVDRKWKKNWRQNLRVEKIF